MSGCVQVARDLSWARSQPSSSMARRMPSWSWPTDSVGLRASRPAPSDHPPKGVSADHATVFRVVDPLELVVDPCFQAGRRLVPLRQGPGGHQHVAQMGDGSVRAHLVEGLVREGHFAAGQPLQCAVPRSACRASAGLLWANWWRPARTAAPPPRAWPCRRRRRAESRDGQPSCKQNSGGCARCGPRGHSLGTPPWRASRRSPNRADGRPGPGGRPGASGHSPHMPVWTAVPACSRWRKPARPPTPPPLLPADHSTSTSLAVARRRTGTPAGRRGIPLQGRALPHMVHSATWRRRWQFPHSGPASPRERTLARRPQPAQVSHRAWSSCKQWAQTAVLSSALVATGRSLAHRPQTSSRAACSQRVHTRRPVRPCKLGVLRPQTAQVGSRRRCSADGLEGSDDPVGPPRRGRCSRW